MSLNKMKVKHEHHLKNQNHQGVNDAILYRFNMLPSGGVKVRDACLPLRSSTKTTLGFHN